MKIDGPAQMLFYPVKITLENVGKKFYHEWIFRNLSLELAYNDSLAVLGPNGSGKSTLLQLIAGHLIPTEGIVHYQDGETEIDGDKIFSYVSFAAPYVEMIEEFTLNEILDFHFRFKKRINNYSTKEIIAIAGLEYQKRKAFKYFSSGMKQRVKLAIALLSDTKIILLDEPCSNLDQEAIKWYRMMTDSYSMNRVAVICSNNMTSEFEFCKQQLNLLDCKQ